MNPNFRPPSPSPAPSETQPQRRGGRLAMLIDLPPGLLIGGAVLLVCFALGAVTLLLESLRWPAFYLMRLLDVATGAQALPIAPWIAWTIWGTAIGGALGYWLVAPSYGQRANRALILIAPIFVLTLLSALLWLCVH